jgi:hypothetical protein
MTGSQLGEVVRDMAHWQLGPVERARERPAGGTARETGTPFSGGGGVGLVNCWFWEGVQNRHNKLQESPRQKNTHTTPIKSSGLGGHSAQWLTLDKAGKHTHLSCISVDPAH